MRGRGGDQNAPEIGGLAAITSGMKRDVSVQDGHGIIQDAVTGQGWRDDHRLRDAR